MEIIRTFTGPWRGVEDVGERWDEAVKAGRAIKILRPYVESADGKWEAVGPGFHFWADTYTELVEQVRDALGVEI